MPDCLEHNRFSNNCSRVSIWKAEGSQGTGTSKYDLLGGVPESIRPRADRSRRPRLRAFRQTAAASRDGLGHGPIGTFVG